jgi:hypothetical protein
MCGLGSTGVPVTLLDARRVESIPDLLGSRKKGRPIKLGRGASLVKGSEREPVDPVEPGS